jgi:hypothetical protein
MLAWRLTDNEFTVVALQRAMEAAETISTRSRSGNERNKHA